MAPDKRKYVISYVKCISHGDNTSISSALLGGAWNWMADVNNLNSVTVADYQLVKTRIPTVYTPS